MKQDKGEKEEKELKISFFSKKEHTCPVCSFSFHKEELLSGGGRLIAGGLTEELHRLYEPSNKYGDVYPLAYYAVVCPECWFSSSEADFQNIPQEKIAIAANDTQKRKRDTLLVFPSVDFSRGRTLIEAAASFFLMTSCYDYYDKFTSPTIKKGISTLRAAWLLDELDKKYKGQHYDWLALLFRKKSQFFYNEALDLEQGGKENMSALKNFGPDIDKNYAYEGMLYICAYLRYKYGPQQGSKARRDSLEVARRTIAKLFGMGKKSKEKPGAFLDLARTIYTAINEELEKMPQETEGA